MITHIVSLLLLLTLTLACKNQQTLATKICIENNLYLWISGKVEAVVPAFDPQGKPLSCNQKEKI